MAERTEAECQDEMLRHHYEQICTSYRAIDDFRGRLLALWPVLGGAAGGIALLASKDTEASYMWAVGLRGAVVSVGLGVCEWHQTLRCDLLKKGRLVQRPAQNQRVLAADPTRVRLSSGPATLTSKR